MKYSVLDLFCGAGGLSLGFQQAGFKIIGGVDFDKSAIETHSYNFGQGIDICGDISLITNDEILSKFPNGTDVIIGGPPCQGFSVANKWQNEQEKIEKNRLFFEYMRFIEVLKPKVFVIENVRQILTKDKGFAKFEIEKIGDQYGYNVVSTVLDSSEFGVPQKRLRAFFIGIKKEYKTSFDFDLVEKAKKRVTVKEAISDLYDLENKSEGSSVKVEPQNAYQEVMRKRAGNEIYNHSVRYPNLKVQERISYVPQGGNWKDVPDHLWDTKRTNRHSSAYRRLSEENVSITIDTGHMNYFHPIYNRVPTVRESARIQSFPDHFVFTGTRGAQFRQVGNAVPPLLAKSLAKGILSILEGVS
ncbi:DNA cytosine methyltransferase [Erysipelothrix rhusiopathiae]|nr:DNA cytosine methyltransferase [Erysipelothrix rhusiopathiae]